MKEVRVRLQTQSIDCLELAHFGRLVIANVSWEMLVDEEIPNFLSALPGVESFVLRIAHPAELLVGRWRLCSVALTHQLNDSFALIDLLAKQSAQIAAFSAKDVLPDRLITEKGQGVRHELPGASKFPTNRRNEN